MKKEEKKNYINAPTVGAWVTNVFGGIEVKYCDDYYMIVACGTWEGLNKEVHKVKIYYGMKGPYIRLFNRRYYLSECVC